MHSTDQETDQYQKEYNIDMVNINSINFKSKCSVITALLKTSPNQARVIARYKVDTGSDGNIMPFPIYKNYSLGPQTNNVWQQKDSKPYQAPLRCIAYALQKTFKVES